MPRSARAATVLPGRPVACDAFGCLHQISSTKARSMCQQPSRRSQGHICLDKRRIAMATCLLACVQAVQSMAFQVVSPPAWATQGAGRSWNSHSTCGSIGILALRTSSSGGCRSLDMRDASVGPSSPTSFVDTTPKSLVSNKRLALARCAPAQQRRSLSSAATTVLQAARRSGAQPGGDDDEDRLSAQWEAELQARSPLHRRAGDERLRGVVRDPWEDKQMKRVDFPRSSR